MALFKLRSPFSPAGSQPGAIAKLQHQRPGSSVLMGVTGSGKTFTIANVIAQQDRPVLILSPNKTLAAQLYEEFSVFFPENKVCYFVSYYDYYQPESYLPAQDIYIPKETKVNSELERLRIESTASLVNRPDTIVIASVSCIYSLGDPADYRNLALPLSKGQKIARSDFLRQLVAIQYNRNDVEASSGTFQVRGQIVDINLPYQKERLRVEFFGDEIEALTWVDKQNSNVLMHLDTTLIFPAKHFVSTVEKREAAIKSIEAELEAWAPNVSNLLYRERIKQRVSHDIEMLREVGYCSGIENYSIHFDGRQTGQKPYTLFDFFPEDFLVVIDESHIAIPQFRGMYAGDRSRKKSLIEFGFRLPSAFDNRPLKFEEIEEYLKNVIYVSATPGPYELERSQEVVEQIIRPTGLVDPEITVHGRFDQMKHLIKQITKTTEAGYRTLIMVLTKKLAEEVARYLQEQQVKVCYLHSELKTPQRSELLHKLRLGIFDCLVGVNLLREGIDLPEVALVVIMDADVESFLRDKRSLIQIIGRAARNADARVLLYADKITQSMHEAMEETGRRRMLQLEHNLAYNIKPLSVKREVTKSISSIQQAIADASEKKKKKIPKINPEDIASRMATLEEQMQEAADKFEFEKAITLRDEWLSLQALTIKK